MKTFELFGLQLRIQYQTLFISNANTLYIRTNLLGWKSIHRAFSAIKFLLIVNEY